MSRQRVYCCAATALLFFLLTVGGSVLTARQEPPPFVPVPPPPTLDKMFEAYDLKPHPLPAIPDPAPHEGAMIDYPEVIEPPDLILVEVLEALPGRPISGERLVRSDGTISLGFYGDVHVAGLTPQQAKVKIIKHLRRFLNDEALGLCEFEPSPKEENPGDAKPPKALEAVPDMPKDGDPFELDQEKKPKAEVSKPRGVPSGYKVRSAGQGKEVPSHYHRSRPGANIRLVEHRQEQEEKKAGEPRKSVKVPLEAGGQVTITIEPQSGERKAKEKVAADAGERSSDLVIVMAPGDSDKVFVNITAYNSKNYYLEGDLVTPGRLPFTGRETVMDAVNYGGGLLPTAEPKDIRLVRPGRGGKPTRVYKVDLESIREKGDVTSNYQIFPGDRLIVGRNDVVKKTIQVDRLAAGMQTIITAISQESSLLRSLKTTSPENHEAMLKDLVDFWIMEMKRPDGVVLDEQTLREALIRRIQARPEKPSERK